jgi:SecD/SecF fusion protein
MLQNAGRLIALTAVLLAVSLLLLVLPQPPLRMGLDLAGGTRLLYQLPIDQARKDGLLSPQETDAQVMEEQIQIIRERIDPQGVIDPTIRSVGRDGIEIALPKTIESRQAGGSAPLSETLTAESKRATLQGESSTLTGFPGGGGVIAIGAERIRYSQRTQNVLEIAERGFDRSTPVQHEAGEAVTLVSDDAIKNAIENLGDLRFMAVATATDFTAKGTDQQSEYERLTTWYAKPENAGLPIDTYNRLSYEQGGPPAGIQWYPLRGEEGEEVKPIPQRSLALTKPEKDEWNFTGSDLARVFRSTDQSGFPAIGFEMTDNAKLDFGEFTEEHVEEQMAIVLNDEIVSAPKINEKLGGSSIIQGRFTDREVNEMVTVLRSGSLKIKPVLEAEERVGATLGEDYIRRGVLGGLVALVLTMGYMILYYRRLGVFAGIALLCNLLMLMGAMVALQATLTLPGIAGIVLTVGMAFDANILIFDRLREEAEKGHKTLQAAKEGFQNALSAIVDGNVTTLITALILYNIGSGPIRGYAVTLSVGILTSLFSALVVTRILVHLALKRGVKEFKMARWLADANFHFVRYGKIAVTGSALAILSGIVLFIALPEHQKLGIDFLGGASLKVRTQAAMTPGELRTRVAQLPGDLAQADVAALPNSEIGEGRFDEFRITFKAESKHGDGAEGETSEGLERTFEREVRTALSDVLQKGPIEVGIDPDTRRTDVVLYFEGPHSVEDVKKALEGTPLAGAEVALREGRQDVYTVTGTVPPETNATTLQAVIGPQFTGKNDSAGREFSLANPIAETNVIGAQVVGELRDSAIRALLLSVLLTVIYIRVRFAEYSYGWAAVVAVVHDVLATLGAVAVLVAVPFIHIEMNLTIIAAFLTIFGYSLNDTIVIFDRVRENLPRVKGTFRDVVDLSCSQTLSRTICTSGTVLICTLVILIFNLGTGNALESFGFAMTFGVIVGSYSTLYIACPVLVWLEERKQRKLGGGKGGGHSTKRNGQPDQSPARA